MKRGLKLRGIGLREVVIVPRPNPGPDEEGIETLFLVLSEPRPRCPNPGPDEEGIETYDFALLQT